MTRHKIALIPGDGIGVPVTEAAIAVARAAGADLDTTSFPWSCEHHLETGAMMPADGIETLRRFDAICVRANRTSLALAAGKRDHSSAAVPVTKGAAALVPENSRKAPSGRRLRMFSPGARTPRTAMDRLTFASAPGRPAASHASTGSTQGCRVTAELPIDAIHPM